MHRTILAIVVFASAVTSVFAQANDPLCFPMKSRSMPEWAEYLYERPLNMNHIDSAYAAYYKSHELEKDAYVRFYIHWRHSLAPYVSSDGSVHVPTAEQREAEYKRSHETSSIQQNTDTWTALTMDTYFPGSTKCPWQSNVYAFDISRSNPNILVCGTEPGGIYRTTNKGMTWSMIGKSYSLGTEAISIHPTDPNTIYIGTGGDIRKTTDAGSTWTTVYSNSSNYVYAMNVHPVNPNIVLAATSMGLFRSVDGGSNWDQVLTGTDCAVAFHPVVSSTVYTLLYNQTTLSYEFWRSTDNGATFSKSIEGWAVDSANGGGRFAVTLADPNRIYVVLLTASGPKILRSNDLGSTWSLTVSGGTDSLAMTNWQGWYDLAIVASQSDPDQVIVGTASEYKSTDGGKSFSIIGGYGGNFALHPDFQDAHAIGNDTWIASDGGLTYSTDFFTDVANAECRMTGVNGSDFWGFDAGWNEDIMVGGRYHNGNTAYNEAYLGKFMRMGGAESATGYVNPMRSHQTYFSDIGPYVIPDSFANQFVSIAMSKYPNESYYTLWYSRMVWDPRCYNTLWLGNKQVLWRSTDGGATFDSIFADSDASALIQHIEISRSNPDVMYVTSHNIDGVIYRTADAGAHWTELPRPAGLASGECRISNIALSESNENELWWGLQSGTTAHRVFHSTDGGQTWTNMTTPTIANIYLCDIMHQMGTDGGIYIAGAGSMYYRNRSMSDWKSYSSGLPLSHYTRGLRPFYRDGKIRAGSNLGIWEAPLFEQSKPVAQPTVDKRFSDCPRDTFYFDDYSVLRHSEATWHWSFPGATYVSSTTVPNPKVVYANPGTYDITLTVTQGSDSSTKTIPAMITVPADQCGFDPLPGLAADLSKDSTDFITIPPLPLKTNHFTAMCWVKPQGIQHDWAAIFQNDNATGFGFTAGTNEMEYHWNGQQWWWNSGLIIAPDVWSHVAIVVTPDSTTLYVNGVGVTNPVPNDTFDFSAAISRLGQDRGYGSVRNFNGLIDEFAVYDRSLTREEVRKTMHITHSSSERGLFLYYQFDEPAFSETFDRIGVNHGDGTNRTISTAPFASGTSVLDTIEGPGVYQFGLAGVELRSSRSDTSPEREICAYRLQGPPDSLPSMNGKYTDHYWIIRSWGGATSGAVDTLAFLNIGAISASDSAALADHFVLLGREANAEQNDWSPFVNKPIQAFSGIANSLWYSFPDSTISDYQFEIANTGTSTLGVPPAVLPVYSNTLRISPNPATDRVIVFYDTRSSDIATQLVVTDLLGRVLEERVLLDHVSGAQTTTVDLSRYPDGSYLIRVGDKTAIIVKD